MIDPHVHLRDWNQNNKETVRHGLKVAYRAGLDAIFEMPNTDPALTSRTNLIKRISLGDYALKGEGTKIFHGIYAGLTSDERQIKEVVRAYKELFPRVVGLKMFAGQSTGNMGIIELKDQALIYKTLSQLDYKGVLAVHCEKESLLEKNLWNPKKPETHADARPEIAEYESIKDQIKLAKEYDFRGKLHICHISTPSAVELVNKERKQMKISCGVTPHHCVLNIKYLHDEKGILRKMNPPLRDISSQTQLLKYLLNGKIDFIETDHAPHTLKDKFEKHSSGIPGFPYYPYFVETIRKKISEEQLRRLTHENIVNLFGIDIPHTQRKPDFNLASEYEFDPYKRE